MPPKNPFVVCARKSISKGHERHNENCRMQCVATRRAVRRLVLVAITLMHLSHDMCARGCALLCVAAMVWLPMSSLYAGDYSPNGNAALGPLMMSSLSAGNIFRPSGNISGPSYAPAGSCVLITSFSWVNIWNVEEDHFMVDGEWLRLVTRLSYMLTDNLEVGINAPFMGRTGGFADGFIEDFHKAFGFGTADRDAYPRNRCVQDVTMPDGRHAHWDGDQWGLSDMSGFVSWTLTKGDMFLPCIVGGAVVSLPTGDEDELLGAGTPVFGISCRLTKRISTTHLVLFFEASLSYSDNDETFGIETQKTQFDMLFGAEYEWSDRLSFIIQNLSASPSAVDYYEFSDPTNELNVGFRIRDGFRGDWEISFQENLFRFNNSADVGLYVAYRQVL